MTLRIRLWGPPRQRQSSSHSLHSSHDGSAGKTRSGITPRHDDGSFRQDAAGREPASTSTYRHPAYSVTMGASGKITSSVPVSR